MCGNTVMRLRALPLGVLASIAAWLLSSTTARSSGAAATPPTFNRDIAPILHARCASCHRSNDVAPMPLLTYQDARPYARAIKAKVAEREMPPWPADPRYGKFSNENRLTDAQIATLTA